MIIWAPESGVGGLGVRDLGGESLPLSVVPGCVRVVTSAGVAVVAGCGGGLAPVHLTAAKGRITVDGLINWFSYVGDNTDKIVEATLQHARIALVVIAAATVFAVAVDSAGVVYAGTSPGGVVYKITNVCLSVQYPAVSIGHGLLMLR